MNDDGRSSPEPPPQDLWSSILDSVSSTRSIPSKQVLLLGQPSTGKSAIAAALLQKPVADQNKEDERSDFAIGYDFADVRDDGDEDTLARLSVYTIPSSSNSYTSLLPHFLPPRTSLPHTLVIIALDWTRPWTFMEELETWLQWVERWAKGDRSRELEIIREENHERLQSYLQHYTEPTAEPLPTTNSTLSNTLLPLGPGTLTHNSAGVPIIVVCTKADLIDEGHDMVAGASGMSGMVKGKGGAWEERTDSIMQVLRTICLKYGSSLFYVTPLPATLQVLRQYALHLLSMPPAPSPSVTSSDAPASIRHIFPFNHKPNTLDRDRIVVPVGWDSWGKISVLRDGFDAKMWGEAWERDLSNEESHPGEEPGAKKLYSILVPDQGLKPPPLLPFNNPMLEQTFLAKHYDDAKKPERDSRGVPRELMDMAGAPAGIVGPLGSSSFNLPHVDRALSEMQTGSGPPAVSGATSGDPGRRLNTRTTSTTNRPAALSSSVSRPPTSPTPMGTSPSPTGGQTQHEVLQNFFQSLLTSKDHRPGANMGNRPPASRAGGAAPGGTETGVEEGAGSDRQ
ncbi:hypothetical protein AMATHDRAFT_148080 [Amanita thiersii Skay4041]|uniref:Dynein light intermediate chain n=1 Tax=Amanita thiersii Skay4041 TaxID=703135 RepID=A0A2A9NNB3_9AGAR|nr:hypothetical protein AMATHDRAFT_148080 [Amanita thiersii Skay4041]